MTTIKLQIQEDMKSAMRAKDQPRLNVIRLILAALKQREVDERCEMTDDKTLATLDKMVKQRLESIAQYQKASRDDLVTQEQFELDLIRTYLPTPLTDTEITALIEAAFQETGASTIKDMGKVVNHLKTQCQGRADMAAISQRVKERLA